MLQQLQAADAALRTQGSVRLVELMNRLMVLLTSSDLSPIQSASMVKVLRAASQKHAIYMVQLMEQLTYDGDWDTCT